MLFILTGDVQIGKTRWLERLVARLQEEGAIPCGVIAPGVWEYRGQPDAHEEADVVDANGFEKLGIDNVLLPEGTRIAFARRADLAERDGAFDPSNQSAQANLLWHISENAINQVNAHFAALRAQTSEGRTNAGDTGASRRLLVIDELGVLELLRGGGLTEAVGLLDDGPSDVFPHALIVVREWLLDEAHKRFTNWDDIQPIAPTGDDFELVLRTVLGS